ncbi:hypothetical protein CY34DRAFT_812131 [Suillus luteus UH-Slu-Lm8-n1]|uniref:Uncharacterized protein n=1 Tax=Suillus luteus UH-Slu-Lm8-n1 TaxID=930992 RepID=A0A0D0ABL4_9AGAM|nr:hypothetical protein CY34DRAFT_812131 [Suillus luteus UH-Slu-Lm8-n1]
MNQSWRLREHFLAMKLPHNFRPRCGALTQREKLIRHIEPLEIRDIDLLPVDLNFPVSALNTWVSRS